ncbi:hypothetical protein [Chitiniphilus eburneus]|uniref:hypothetical protein n=1 Tax=Chitiniphilus eburneus TaxID=2571148 RepID=UPI0035D131C1
MRKLRLICLSAMTALAIPLAAFAADMDPNPALTTVRDKLEITQVLATIPFQDKSMPYKSLADRLPNLNMEIERITFGKVEPLDIEDSGGLLKKGDVFYDFNIKKINKVVSENYCQISSRFSVVKRKGKWIPQDRTGNFLISNICRVP